MANVNVTVYQDNTGTYPDGCGKSVSSNSVVLGMSNVQMYPNIESCGGQPGEYMSLLHINDPVYGNLWISETEQSFVLKVQQAANSSASSGEWLRLQSKIGDPGQPTPGNTVTYAALVGKTIVEVYVDGPQVYEGESWTFDSSTGTLDFTLNGGIGDESILVVYYK